MALKGHYEAGAVVNQEMSPSKFVDYIGDLIVALREKKINARPLKYDPSKAGGVDVGEYFFSIHLLLILLLFIIIILLIYFIFLIFSFILSPPFYIRYCSGQGPGRASEGTD